jgi:carbon monoxide dehydrogenase subunit G
MKLEHHFTVPAPIDTVWQALLDPERVAPCFPGAAVTSVNGDEFAGIVKVRLGPISLQYRGSGRFTETDEAVHRTVIKAAGTAAGGQGTVAATVQATHAENGEGTAVTVATDLTVTGKPAQFGRGLIEDVGEKIIGQFADCLSRSLGPQDEPAPVAPRPV